MPPPEEKQEEDKVTFGGRKLGNNRMGAKDPFSFLDKPAQPAPTEENKGVAAKGDVDEKTAEIPSEPKKLTYEQRMAQERQKGGSLLEMLGHTKTQAEKSSLLNDISANKNET